jgi:hypothetical protein
LNAGEESVEMAEVSGVEAPGPLGPFVAGFAAELSRQGYKPQPVGKQIGLVAALSSWLAAEGVAVSGLSSDVAEQFCAARRAAGHTNRATVRSLDPLLGYLRALGVVPPGSILAPAGPVEELLAGFRRYLESERGLVPAAARGYVDEVRPFVARFDGPDGLELWRRTRRDDRVGPADRAQTPRTRAGLLSHERELDALIGAPDRSSWTGRRDHAIIILLAQSGLRASELTGLRCGDIHLGSGAHAATTGKGRKQRITPLTKETAAVLSVWLAERGSPPTEPLFPTSTGKPLTRKALARRIAKHATQAAERCPSLTAPSPWTANPAATARQTRSSDFWTDCDYAPSCGSSASVRSQVRGRCVNTRDGHRSARRSGIAGRHP